jgi:hypothetical protein
MIDRLQALFPFMKAMGGGMKSIGKFIEEGT